MTDNYQVIEEEPWRAEGIRKIIVNNFLVYYWINVPDKKVHIIAVIYAKRNQLEQLKYIDMSD